MLRLGTASRSGPLVGVGRDGGGARAGRVERAPHTPVGSLCEMLHIEEELHPAQRRGRFEAVATHVLDDAAIGDINLTYDERAKGSARSTTTAGASKDALKSFEKARAEANDNHPDKAARDLQTGTQRVPHRSHSSPRH